MKTTRREFASRLGCGAAMLAVHGCTRAALARNASGDAASAGSAEAAKLREMLGVDREQILAKAARAPSSHNSQPWQVRVLAPDDWTIRPDASRRLPVVDPADRELSLSLGGFVEYLMTAATALGFDAHLEQTRGASVPCCVRVRLSKARPGVRDVQQLDRIARRRTLRKGYSDAPLSKEDLARLSDALGSRAQWFPRGTKEAEWIAEMAVESFRQQTWRDPVQRELARWIRFSDAEASNAADGLTPQTMEIAGLTGFYMRHFMDPGSVTGKSFRECGVDAVSEQARAGAGWLVLGAPDESDGSLLQAGRSFARMALLLRERRLGVHPMSQVLEEAPWRAEMRRALRVGAPQFVLRVGYVERYSDPVSLRRPVSSFASLL